MIGRSESHPIYCCSGCRFAAGIAGGDGEAGLNRWALARLGAAIFLSMNVMVFTMALWARDLDAGGASQLDVVLAGVFRYLALIFTLPVLWLLGQPLATGAVESLRAGRQSTDLLLLSGVVAAMALSIVSVILDHGPVYFEVACGVLVFVTLGRWLEAHGKQQAGESLKNLERFLPETARRRIRNREDIVPIGDVRPGDVLRAVPGERIACDGSIIRHAAAIDEQLLTGESQPSIKEVGDRVLAGSLAVDSDVWFTVTALPAESTASRFLAAVRRSLESRGGFERVADRVSRWFLPTVAVIAVLAAAVHALLHGPGAGVLAGLAVILIACPCALAVATPLAVWATVGRAARLGILFRTPEALERLSTIRAVRLDKTGTLTTGRAAVRSLHVATGESDETVWRIAASLAAASSHPFSVAIADAASELGLKLLATIGPVRSSPGRGLETESAALGSPAFLTSAGYGWTSQLAEECGRQMASGSPVSAVGQAGRVIGFLVLTEDLRPEACSALQELQKRGLDVAILTGDQPARANAIMQELGVPAIGGLLPEDKIAAIHRARVALGPVAMIGDGLNDAGALAAADAGIALGCGADVTREVADICLLGNNLQRLADAIDLSRQARRTIRQNLFWAMAFNTTGIALACTGYLNPLWAALAMVVSSFSVLGNSLRLAVAADASQPGESQPAPETARVEL